MKETPNQSSKQGVLIFGFSFAIFECLGRGLAFIALKKDS
jgi:hypothetical protein